ncbi:MAG: hypothetical protein JNM57_16135 [Cyclobacteriaceae bacterium]|nr:hypothetical protein [Cyclobacteriaceae bacterium]
MIVQNKYKEGDIVFERTHPSQKLVVRSYAGGIYYCKDEAFRNRNQLVYFERDLMAAVQP